MDRFVTRAPTWKTLEMSSFSRSFANVSLTDKRSTPKENKLKSQSTNKRLSIRDEKLLKIFTGQADEPLMLTPTQDLSPYAARFDGSFGGSQAVNSNQNNSLRLIPNDENTPPPNARITSAKDQPAMDNNLRSSGENGGSRPSTPTTNMIPTNFVSCTPKDNPFIARIQRDLNSPSAATRVRALKALKSPTKSAYAIFDVPHEEQEILTEEERKPPVKVNSIQELMKDVVVYVEVRTGEDNRSSGVKNVISALGAKVNDKLLRDTTHVVFKDGLQSTYNKAKKWNIPIVSILWIEACKKHMGLMHPKDFPISNADRYENPELYDKMKRYRSMQPDAEDKRRQRVRVPTKENGLKAKSVEVAPSPSLVPAKKKNDISRFFTQLQSQTSNALDSPCTQMLQKINENFCSPKITSNESLKKLAYLDTVSSLSDTNELSTETDGATKKHDLVNCENKPNTSAATKTSSRRRNSIQVTQTTNTSNNVPRTENNIAVTPNLRTRRQSSVHIPSNMSISKKEKDASSKKNFASISEEIAENTDPDVGVRQTTFTEQSVDITKGNDPPASAQKNRRRTLYTPKPMEESQPKSASLSTLSTANKRRTVFATSSSNACDDSSFGSFAPITPIGRAVPCSTLIGEESASTPLQLPSLLEEHATATIFSSTRTPVNPRRRTLFDVSMDIISQRLQNINQSAKSVRDARPEDRRSSQDDPQTIAAFLTPKNNNNLTIRKELFVGNEASAQKEISIAATPSQSAKETASNTPIENIAKKKRKLFVPNDIFLTPTATASLSEDSNTNALAKRILSPATTPLSKSATQKRRRTIMPTLTQPKTEQKKPAPKVSGGRSTRRSTMDFEAIKKAKSVINKSAAAAKPTNGAINTIKPKPYPFLVYTNMHTEQIEFIKEAISKLKGFQIEKNVSDNTTHIVSLEPRRTFNLLRGLVRGLWILTYDWIVDSVKAGEWLNEEEYEMRSFSRAVEICRSERQAFGNGYKMDIFSGVGPIFISSKCSIPKDCLTELVKLCAGRIVDNRKRAKYIVGDSSPTLIPNRIYVEPHWILDSISNNSIQKLSKYVANTSTEEK